MAMFFLLVLVFSSQVISGINAQVLPTSTANDDNENGGNLVTILSIDGGAIRGIIPAVVIEYLENALQEKDKDATLAKYFDVIAGTNTGGLIAAMLTTPDPNDNNSPLYNANQILQFFFEYGPSIYNQTSASNWTSTYPGPRYDGQFFRYITREVLKDTRLSEALTNVVIPTFDIKTFNPVIFSSLKVNEYPSLNAKLSDICIGGSAAPTYLPPHHFENDNTEFNLADGGFAAYNPATVAVSEVIQKKRENTKILLVSIGGGTEKHVGYDAREAAEFSAHFWATSGLLPMAFDLASEDMTEYYLATVFPGLQPAHNYLRIQEYNLDESVSSMDNSSEANMENLIKVGQNLLKQPVYSLNVVNFEPVQEPHLGTNAQALDRVAEILYEEKQLRLRKQSMKKKGTATY